MIVQTFQTIAMYVGYFFISLILVEIFSKLLLNYLTFKNIPGTKELRRADLINPLFKTCDSYGIEDAWRQQYYKEVDEIFSNSHQALNKWKPLGLWCAPRYHGKCINIEKYNLRKTIHTDFDPIKQNEKIRVCFFGGSQVWGWEVRDQSTIPSILSSLRDDAIIENHGQLGFVSTQSLITFLERIKHNPKPDVVIFIDGFNDIYAAFQSKIAGIEQNAISRKARFESKNIESIFEFYKRKSRVFNLFDLISQTEMGFVEDINTQNEELASSIITSYNHNVSIIKAIARSYNFKPIFIWQPTIFDKPNLTEYEYKVMNMNRCKSLCASVKKIISTSNTLSLSVINLSDLFQKNEEPLFVDPFHYNEHANYLLTQKINDAIDVELKKDGMYSKKSKYPVVITHPLTGGLTVC